MASIMKRNPKAFMMAVVMHLVLVIFLLFGVDWLKDPESGAPKVEVVKAKVIDERQIMAEAEKLKQEKQQAKAKRLAEKTKAQKELERLKKQQADLKKKQVSEKKRLAALEKKRKAEAKKQALSRKKAAAEKKRKAAVAKKKAEAKKRADAEKRAAAEKRRKAEAARKRREAKARRQREADLRKSLEAEQNSRAIRLFAIAVGDKVTGNWRRPPGTSVGLSCKVRVRLSTNGTVLGVQVVKSSGNTAFDRSAEAAVFKSDPLPAPPAGMREITFIFDPDKSR